MRTFIVVTALIFGVGCAQTQPLRGNEDVDVGKEKSAVAPAVVTALAKGNNAFAFDLYGKLAAKDGNLFFSPFSISTALGMTYAGARGDTAAEMARTLHFSRDEAPHSAFRGLLAQINEKRKKPAYALSVANALWGQKDFGFLPDFINLTGAEYGAGLRQVDFVNATETARKLINDWVEDRTQHKIKELLKPGILDADTRLVLTNAIYFKGLWASQFKKSATRDDTFKTSATETVKVPMMQQTGDFPYFESEDMQLVQLPYEGKDVSMIVVLPRKVDGLPALEKQLTSARVAGWIGKLAPREVNLALPRFKMTAEFSLKKVLSDLGIPSAFIPGKADLTGMNGTGQRLFISAVVHKAFVDVNEEGTEAAAATAVVAKTTSARLTHVFKADHPFVFLIRDNRSGSVLFMGRVANPGK
ncbi:MAG: serpin family protein [Planctomycetes bacterium]|nr:serpin family protein [Planctomycetota bacterium]